MRDFLFGFFFFSCLGSCLDIFLFQGHSGRDRSDDKTPRSLKSDSPKEEETIRLELEARRTSEDRRDGGSTGPQALQCWAACWTDGGIWILTSLYDTRMLPRGAANLNLQFDTSSPKRTLGVFQRCSSVLIFNLQNGKNTGVDYPLSLSYLKGGLELIFAFTAP